MARRQADDLPALRIVEKRIGTNDDCIDLPLNKGREGRIDFALGTALRTTTCRLRMRPASCTAMPGKIIDITKRFLGVFALSWIATTN
jgi:hypothetical protein